MTKIGNIITVDPKEASSQFQVLLDAVRQGALVRIVDGEKPIAELQPPQRRRDPLKQHPELMGVKFADDPASPLDEEDWPSELR